MGTTTATYGHVNVTASRTEVGDAVGPQDGAYHVRITSYREPVMVYVDGTLDELAQFVADLADVVRELSTRELAAANAKVAS